ncbi:Large exoproteins involved in heme utilization or adhesion [Anaerovibrio sp. JC8]|uniref:autotransporter outer membrane beta-barrel domain-containing protein n=1 Tax=Anaerovibrio sp. JC8 TaxID=1240085 RepID=UPI000A0B3C7F|nr:autotransporter outer membrane beta-barrel domain-containing protein [Anaerovibrio sp. JC8]ORU01116.1 Large exoproteins involved in heme utilization or adhesion [Anaerovibrio sp. JC8]
MKSKKSKQELTRLILAALILGSGSLFGPVAEAEELPITENPSGGAYSANVDGFQDEQQQTVYYLKDGTTYTGLKVNSSSLNIWGFSGGYSATDNVGLSGRTVTLKNGNVEYIYGGYGNYSSPQNNNLINNNTVTIDGGSFKRVFGGYGSGNGEANYNKVEITAGSSTATTSSIGYITGAAAKKMRYNSVTISGGTFTNGNYIGGVYAVNSNVASPNIMEHNSLNLYGTTTGLENAIIAGAFAATVSGGSGSFTDNNIYIGGSRVYNGSTTATITTAANAWSGSSNNTVKMVKSADSIVLRKVNWSESVPVLKATSGIGFQNGAKLDISNINILNSAPGTMTLLEGAWYQGTPDAQTPQSLNSITVTYNGGSQTFNSTTKSKVINAGTPNTPQTLTNNVTLKKLVGKTTLSINDAYNKVQYTIAKDKLTGIDLAGWDASNTVALSTTDLENGLTAGSITATGTFAPTLPEGTTSKNILTASEGFFTDNQIADAIAYKSEGEEFRNDFQNGIIMEGNGSGGVKVSSNGSALTYYAGIHGVKEITLEQMAWGTSMAAPTGYEFSGLTKLDASNLTFTGKATAPNASISMITGATGLDSATSYTLTQPVNAKVAAEFTDNNIAYKGTGTGTVGVSGTDVKYTITGGTISSMNLNGWTGADGMGLPTNWTGTNIAVETGNFPSLAEDKILFNNLAANTFGTVSGSKVYKSDERVTDDTQNGVTLAGGKTGGIKTEDSGATLKYYAESMAVDTITLGEMKWDTGREITGTGYNFNNVGNNGVDASKLTFTFDGATSVNDVATGNHWRLLYGANNLKPNLTVKGSPVSQKVSYGINNAANLTGTLKGDVTTGDGIVQYAVTSKTLETVDISKWDGSSTGTVNSTWGKLDSGIIAVTGSGFKTPTAVGDYNILTATPTGFFTGAKIDSAIAYQPSGTYSETENNITISGKQAKGVKASGDGTALQYSIGAAYIDTIGLGKVTYNKGAVLMDKSSAMYNYSSVKSLDKSGFGINMSDDQKKTAKANDFMTLLKANNTLNNIVAQDTGKLNYTYTANPGLTVKGAVTGNVSASGGSVLYTVDSNKASDINVGKVAWNSSYARSADEIAYTDAFVNADNVAFTGVSTLNKGDTMKLVTNFGNSVNKVRGGIFTLDNGKTGKGHAYWDSATQSLVYVVDRGIDEEVETKNAVATKTTVDGENPHKGDVPGGEAQGDGEAKDNETKVKNSHIQKNDDGTGGDVNGGTSEDGDSTNNKAAVEDSEVDGDVNGGKSDTGNTKNNKTDIENTTVHGDVNGGSTSGGSGESSGNETTVGGNSTVDGDVNGGKTGGEGGTKENKVDVKGGSKVGGNVNGGHSGGNGESSGNEATVEGQSQVDGDVNGGKSDGNGDTKNNKADVKGGSKVGGNVNGGHSGGNGESSGNEATVEGQSQVTGDVTGGKSESGNTSENKANVKDGSTVGGSVIGGKTESGNTNKNEANVTGGSKVEKNVVGGQTNGSGTSNENKANVTGSEVGGNVVGGYSEKGNTNKNETAVTGGSKVTGNVIGGQSNGGGTSNENKANVTKSTVGGNVIGGYSKNGTVSTNEANVTGGSVGGSVYGGKTDGTEAAASNNVTLDGDVKVKGAVYGGYSENGTADGNVVTVKKAAVDDYIYGGKSKIRSSNDLVYFHDGTVLGIIGGGCDEAVSNSVSLLKGGVTEHVIGGFATTTATGNTVTLTGGTVNGSVIGGYGGTTTADNNTVNLGGGTVSGNTITSATLGVTIDGGVYGGYSVSGTTQNNTVNLFGTADVSNTGLFGGNLQYNGNILNIGYNKTPWTGGDQSVKNIKNFESMNFSVAPWSKSKAAVTISDGTASDLSMTTVGAKNVEFTGVKVVAVDDTMTLLDQSAVTNKAVNVNEDSDFTIGIAVEGTGKVALDANGNVVYNVKSVRATEQTHNTLMGAEATMTTLNVGNDYIGSAVDGLALPENTGKDGLATFAKLGGGKLTQETGSHIDVSTWNAILALGHKNVKKHSTFEYGAFFEYGNGNYTTYNDAAQRGDGSTRYTGGGLLAKWYTPKGLYVEGSLRAGTVHEDANSLLRDNMGNAYSYNTDTGYYGFHVGVGRELKLDRHTVLDVYAKYFYNHRNGTDFTVAGADYRLDDITSSLLRVGARYTEKRDDQWSFYGGLAYEYEMCGRAYGTVNGVDIRGADIGGGRIRGEIGAFMKPTADTPWGVDLNLTAYAGKKQGVMGSISTVYTF